MTVLHCVAVDLGASSGRIMLARFNREQRKLSLDEIHRFANCLVNVDGVETWDIDALEQEILYGLTLACDAGIPIDSMGIDTWGVDYVLLDKQGQRVGLPVSYRDSRTDGIMTRAVAELGRDNIYTRSGIQFLSFNTLYQLRALVEQQPALTAKVTHALLIPDYFSYRLTGVMNWEYTNATTTQLINIDSRNWDPTLLDWAGVPPTWFAKPTSPGNVIGHWNTPQERAIPVIAVASHDTASAVLAAPLMDKNAAYLSSGTWSLMGFESQTPYTSEAALSANITNEGGADGGYRVLKNIMGLWLLQRVLKEQNVTDLATVIQEAQCLPACRSIINPNDERFINPVHMSTEIAHACRDAQQPIPVRPAELARCIFDSLALLYANVLNELAQLRGAPFSQLHIVGGGCQNPLLNQLCADACGINVIAGPIEASTLGNIGMQLMTLGAFSSIEEFRRQTADPLTTFTPNPRHDIVRHAARFHIKKLTKEICA